MASKFENGAGTGGNSRLSLPLFIVAAFFVGFIGAECAAQAAPPLPGVVEVIVDTTAPTPGTIAGPIEHVAGTITLTYSGAGDSPQGSGLAAVTLWMKNSVDGTWASTEATGAGTAGQLSLNNSLPDGSYHFALRATDNAGNDSGPPDDSNATSLRLDTTAPVLTLNGQDFMRLELDAPYVEPGATARDAFDGDLTARIQISGEVAVGKIGEYPIRYSVTDDSGNKSEVVRTVSVGPGTTQYTWGDVNGDGVAGDSDVALLLQRSVDLVSEFPGESAELSASVSGEEPAVVGAYDAALVLQRSSGIGKPFPVDNNGDGMGPEPEGSSVTIPRFAGVRNLYLNTGVDAEAGVEIALPIWLDSGADVLAFNARVAYSSEALEFMDVAQGSLARTWIDPVVNAMPGLIAVAGAGTQSSQDCGSLCFLRFRTRGLLKAEDVVLRLDAVDLNDGLLSVKTFEQRGAPVLEGITPAKGAECGGTVVSLRGSNLNTITQVLFGGIESPWVQFNPRKGTLNVVAPAGKGRVDLEAISPGGTAKLAGAYEYFAPAVYVTLTPPTSVREGDTVDVPILLSAEGTVRPTAMTFRLYYDNYRFVVPQAEGEAPVAVGPALTKAGKTVSARHIRPGEILVTISGSPSVEIQPGVLCNCRLIAIGRADASSLMSISMVSATGNRMQPLAMDAGVIR